ncbi:hypothetical protein QVG61_04630 [Thiohalobacter sp. IOR34]|nr:hypothetical protein [Thiohalobacter sp. IOR34]WJW76385.1 hypothetical protein QVG61_04630 [Thiohalobacter sp. IOR34]
MSEELQNGVEKSGLGRRIALFVAVKVVVIAAIVVVVVRSV